MSGIVRPGQPDWELAKALLSQGLSRGAIVEQCKLPSTEALRKRMKRGQWARLEPERTEVTSTVSVEVQAEPTDNREIDSLSEKTRTILGEVAARNAVALKDLPAPKSSRAIREHTGLLAAICEAAAMLFGWNTTGGSTTLNIGVLQSAADSAKPMGNNLKAIDVPTEQVVDTKPVGS